MTAKAETSKLEMSKAEPLKPEPRKPAARVQRLNMPSYTGFVQPKLTAIRNDAGHIVDVEISYPCDFRRQMLEYSGRL